MLYPFSINNDLLKTDCNKLLVAEPYPLVLEVVGAVVLQGDVVFVAPRPSSCGTLGAGQTAESL